MKDLIDLKEVYRKLGLIMKLEKIQNRSGISQYSLFEYYINFS